MRAAVICQSCAYAEILLPAVQLSFLLSSLPEFLLLLVPPALAYIPVCLLFSLTLLPASRPQESLLHTRMLAYHSGHNSKGCRKCASVDCESVASQIVRNSLFFGIRTASLRSLRVLDQHLMNAVYEGTVQKTIKQNVHDHMSPSFCDE